MLVIFTYGEFRQAGGKHSAAVGEAAEAVRRQYPGMPISESTVRRILAEFQPKGETASFLVSKPAPGEETLIGPEGKKYRKLFSGGFGPRPVYRRNNAARAASQEKI
jgi:hypothetical protein